MAPEQINMPNVPNVPTEPAILGNFGQFEECMGQLAKGDGIPIITANLVKGDKNFILAQCVSHSTSSTTPRAATKALAPFCCWANRDGNITFLSGVGGPQYIVLQVKGYNIKEEDGPLNLKAQLAYEDGELVDVKKFNDRGELIFPDPVYSEFVYNDNLCCYTGEVHIRINQVTSKMPKKFGVLIYANDEKGNRVAGPYLLRPIEVCSKLRGTKAKGESDKQRLEREYATQLQASRKRPRDEVEEENAHLRQEVLRLKGELHAVKQTLMYAELQREFADLH